MSDTSGPPSRNAFGFFDRGSHCLRTWQRTFLEPSGESLVTLPRSGSLQNGRLYGRPMLGRATSGTESSLLFPTPIALESTPTEEYLDEVAEVGLDPTRRLYLPGRKWHVQRTLSRVAPMFPTPLPALFVPRPSSAVDAL
jgi:hypothetical protein